MINNWAPKKRSKMDMAPLIDIVFLLLIFFMLTFAIQGQGLDISLPEGQAAEDNSEQESLTVKIARNQSIFLNRQPILIKQLEETLKHKLETRSDKSVVVEADKTTPYKLFAKVLDVSRLAGAENFSIVK